MFVSTRIINGKSFVKRAKLGISKSDWRMTGYGPIVKTWKEIFSLSKCNAEHGMCKALDVGSPFSKRLLEIYT